MSTGIRVFCSYSHKDTEFLELLHSHLAVLKRQGLILAWDDRELVPGVKLQSSIQQKLEECDLFIFLVSNNFLSSYWCIEKELAYALEKNEEGTLSVLPVILKSCDWRESEFSHLLALPKDGVAVTVWPDRDSAFQNIVEGVRRTIRQINTGIWSEGNKIAIGPEIVKSERPANLAKPKYTVGSSNLSTMNSINSAIEILRHRLELSGFQYSVHSDIIALDQTRLKVRDSGVSGMMNPGLFNFDAKNSLWLSLSQTHSPASTSDFATVEQLVGLQAFRLDDVRPNLRTWAPAMLEKAARFDLPESEILSSADFESLTADISGLCCYHSELWISKLVKSRNVFEVFARIGLLEAARIFNPKAIWGLASGQMAGHGHLTRVGYTYIERGFLRWKLAPEGIDPVEYIVLARDRDLRKLAREICEENIMP